LEQAPKVRLRALTSAWQGFGVATQNSTGAAKALAQSREPHGPNSKNSCNKTGIPEGEIFVMWVLSHRYSAFIHEKSPIIPLKYLALARPDGTARSCAWRMQMVRTWLATSTALVAAVAFSFSVTEAGARDYRDGHANHGNAPRVRSGPSPSVRHFESVPHIRSGGQPQVHFKSSGGGQIYFNNNYRAQPQIHFNNGGVRPVERYVERHAEHRVEYRRHHRFGRPIINFSLPYVYEPNYYADDECYVWQPAMTPYGWRYMWMNICVDDDLND